METLSTGTPETKIGPSRREALAHLALSTNLPMPRMLRFHDDRGTVSIDLDGIAAGRAWVAAAGGEESDVYAYDNTNGRRYLHAVVEGWHGWKLSIHADEAIELDGGLDDATRTALTGVAEGQR